MGLRMLLANANAGPAAGVMIAFGVNSVINTYDAVNWTRSPAGSALSGLIVTDLKKFGDTYFTANNGYNQIGGTDPSNMGLLYARPWPFSETRMQAVFANKLFAVTRNTQRTGLLSVTKTAATEVTNFTGEINAQLLGIAVGNGIICAVGSQYGGGAGLYATSSDGITFNAALVNTNFFPSGASFIDVAFDGSKFFAVMTSTTLVSPITTSTDGRTWASPVKISGQIAKRIYAWPGSTNALVIADSTGIYSPGGGKLYRSTSGDGKNWSVVSLPSAIFGAGPQLFDIAFYKGTHYIVGKDTATYGIIVATPDFSNYTLLYRETMTNSAITNISILS